MKKEFKKYNITACSVLGLFLALLLSGCEKEDVQLDKPNDNIRSIAGFLENNFDFSLLYAAMEYTGLLDSLDKAGNYTLIAANDKAFNELGLYKEADIYRLDKDSLRRVMGYHIIPRRVMAKDIPLNEIDTRLNTLADVQLYASRATNDTWDYPLIYFSGALTDNTDWQFSNGVIHSVEKLMKPNFGLTIQKWLEQHNEYSIFVAAMKKFGYWDALAAPDLKTVFCPMNDRLIDAGITQSFIDNANPDDYIAARLFGCYIIKGKRFFIRDYDFFLYTQYQYWYTEPIVSDTYHLNFMGQHYFINGQRFFFNYYRYHGRGNVGSPLDFQYSLSVSSRNTPSGYVFGANHSTDILGRGTYADQPVDNYVSYGLYRHLHDNLCENGVVHNLQGVLVLPDEAKIK